MRFLAAVLLALPGGAVRLSPVGLAKKDFFPFYSTKIFSIQGLTFAPKLGTFARDRSRESQVSPSHPLPSFFPFSSFLPLLLSPFSLSSPPSLSSPTSFSLPLALSRPLRLSELSFRLAVDRQHGDGVSGFPCVLPELEFGFWWRGLPATSGEAEPHYVRPLQLRRRIHLSGQAGLVPAGGPGLPDAAGAAVAQSRDPDRDHGEAVSVRLPAALFPQVRTCFVH